MGMQVNIDNGGTLTDICVLKDDNFYKTKTLTTPYDLSKCFFDGLRAVSKEVYGEEDVAKLLAEVEHIRYSTTQGTNAIVERKGPKLGLVLNKGNADLCKRLRVHDEELYDFLVGDRVGEIDLDDLSDKSKAADLATVITTLTSNGANRIVVCFDTDQAGQYESQFKLIAFDTYPRHLLGAVPMLFASELVDDISADRRGWTALLNSFLHPAMEGFLYNAENRLREYRTRNPLLIFRNDGNASRVAKTIALKSYSSGPRGGMEGVKSFSKEYKLTNVLSMDIGGTTTDIGYVANFNVDEDRRGKVEGIAISFGLCEILSEGVGGSSILSIVDGAIQVGPESVGAVPGPASFGRGGKNSTITDVNLLMGLLDPSTYFGGGLALDVERARAAIDENIATPLGLSADEALHKLRSAYEQKIADALSGFAEIKEDTVLLAFGGAGPMNACGVAEKAGINTVFVPKTAAVFSAFGIGSCDIGQNYSVVLTDHKQKALAEAHALLFERAERDMFAEGFAKGDYEISAQLVGEKGTEESVHELDENIAFPQELSGADSITLEVSARKPLKIEDNTQAKVEKLNPAKSSTNRSIMGENQEWQDVPVYEVSYMAPGAHGSGPAIIEEDFFTCLVLEGWEFVVTEAGDIRITRGTK
ncbi:MAG: hydantoinase/oxoprolinase family protein [Gammaproteobacteria bacterium]|nr:MAG: hydantoinase/oxoprolinase family protein [Gammaproteobacteria bacterium]RKZ71488.1 MAG: hydantoinase/oxoprolinase family protein [Gammaproteobacteria bacterium]